MTVRIGDRIRINNSKNLRADCFSKHMKAAIPGSTQIVAQRSYGGIAFEYKGKQYFIYDDEFKTEAEAMLCGYDISENTLFKRRTY